jgi:rubredoxin
MEEDVDKEELRKLLDLYVYECTKCGYQYDEAKMTILFENLPKDFKCPKCGALKSQMQKKP